MIICNCADSGTRIDLLFDDRDNAEHVIMILRRMMNGIIERIIESNGGAQKILSKLQDEDGSYVSILSIFIHLIYNEGNLGHSILYHCSETMYHSYLYSDIATYMGVDADVILFVPTKDLYRIRGDANHIVSKICKYLMMFRDHDIISDEMYDDFDNIYSYMERC